METCQRCGQEGEDRRTLWMACFYDMTELGLPFEECAIKGIYQRHVGTEHLALMPEGPKLRSPQFEARPDAAESRYKFFTLRVCKGCRADWMHAIKSWFDAIPQREPEGALVEGAAYVRDLGANRRMTPDEIEQVSGHNSDS